MRPPPRSPLFPYTTLFRSAQTLREAGPERQRGVDGVVAGAAGDDDVRSEEHTSELQSHHDLVCRLLLEKKKIRRSGTLLFSARPHSPAPPADSSSRTIRWL